MFTVAAPAKINLTLEVLSQRPDSFHEIRSVLQAINLYDSFRFQTGEGITYRSDSPDWSAENSLVSKAVSLLQGFAGGSRGAAIELEKRIPLVSGLGGDSSGAAAMLRGLNRLWELNLPQEKLLDLAAQLGSDVPFFLYGGTALAEGRGEVLTPLPPLANMWAVLVVPDVPRLPGKTKELYNSLKPRHYTDGAITERLVQVLKAGRELEQYLLFNTFENVAFEKFSGLKVYKDHIIKLGAPHVHLAGSGPTLFSMMTDRAQAEDLYTRCKQQGMGTYLVGMGGGGGIQGK
jgi:4-diphosphocytidyl-2-C-methyl-D-erythritol kinase